MAAQNLVNVALFPLFFVLLCLVFFFNFSVCQPTVLPEQMASWQGNLKNYTAETSWSCIFCVYKKVGEKMVVVIAAFSLIVECI